MLQLDQSHLNSSHLIFFPGRGPTRESREASSRIPGRVRVLKTRTSSVRTNIFLNWGKIATERVAKAQGVLPGAGSLQYYCCHFKWARGAYLAPPAFYSVNSSLLSHCEASWAKDCWCRAFIQQNSQPDPPPVNAISCKNYQWLWERLKVYSVAIRITLRSRSIWRRCRQMFQNLEFPVQHLFLYSAYPPPIPTTTFFMKRISGERAVCLFSHLCFLSCIHCFYQIYHCYSFIVLIIV